jgi:hypothetical protein
MAGGLKSVSSARKEMPYGLQRPSLQVPGDLSKILGEKRREKARKDPMTPQPIIILCGLTLFSGGGLSMTCIWKKLSRFALQALWQYLSAMLI